MMMYRSDWPEIGLSRPSVWMSESAFSTPIGSEWNYSIYDDSSGVKFQLQAVLNGFETELYHIPCWDLRMEVFYSDDTPDIFNNRVLQDFLKDSIFSLMSRLSAKHAYVYAKTVASEPLYRALIGAGFEAVEHRCLYQCKIGDLVDYRPLAAHASSSKVISGISYFTLAQAPRNLYAHYQKQILNICRQSFKTGSSRHFSDAYLAQQVSGTEYILAVMKLNFENIAADGFLLAIDQSTGEIIGFSVVGKKPALEEQTYTQLLSAVSPTYQGGGVYRGLTSLLADTFPKNAVLLNVTHMQNEAIRRAYQDSGRIHLTDTILVRQVFGNAHSF